MPTLAGLRRRGVPAAAIRDFVRKVGVARANSLVDVAMFEHAVREHLNRIAPRRMAVLRPLKLVIANYPEGASEESSTRSTTPRMPAAGARRIPFGRELYIERDDFMENPPKKFFRLAPGREVRLRYAYFVTCREVVKNAAGEVVELICSYDPATRGGNAPDGRKVRATLHWVTAAHSLPAEIRLYDPLFTRPDPGAAGDFFADLNPNSLEILTASRVEPALAAAAVGEVGAIRAARIFLPRPRLGIGSPRLQPHRGLARQLDQGADERLSAVGRCRRGTVAGAGTEVCGAWRQWPRMATAAHGDNGEARGGSQAGASAPRPPVDRRLSTVRVLVLSCA